MALQVSMAPLWMWLKQELIDILITFELHNNFFMEISSYKLVNITGPFIVLKI